MTKTSRASVRCYDWRVLRTSLAHQAREFFENSSLHGIRYLAPGDGRNLLERFMWLVFMVLGATATGLIIASLWKKFQTSPTITGLDTDFHDWDVTFPAVTLCPEDSMSEDRLRAFVNASVSSDQEQAMYHLLSVLASSTLNRMDTLRNLSLMPSTLLPHLSPNIRSVIQQVTLPCEALLQECDWKGRPMPCCQMFQPAFTENGYCYSFNSLHSISHLNGSQGFQPEFIFETDATWAVSFHSRVADKNSIKVFIHPWDEVLTREGRPQHVWTGYIKKLSFSAKHTYTTPDARQLSMLQRRCSYEDEVRLATASKYSYSACMAECRMNLAMRLCACVPFYYTLADGYIYCDIPGLMCLAKHSRALQDIDACSCVLGCENTVYDVEKLSDASLSPRGRLEVGFVSWPMVRYKREVLFGWVDLLVSFGGIAGLFLGFSLLSGVELLYYFTMRAACMAAREPDKLLAEMQQSTKDSVHKISGSSRLQCCRLYKRRRKTKIHPIMKRPGHIDWSQVVLHKNNSILPLQLQYLP